MRIKIGGMCHRKIAFQIMNKILRGLFNLFSTKAKISEIAYFSSHYLP